MFKQLLFILLLYLVRSNVVDSAEDEFPGPEPEVQSEELASETAEEPVITPNQTIGNVSAEPAKTKFVSCLPGMGDGTVQLVNETELIYLLMPESKTREKITRDVPSKCTLVLFYTKNCPFCSMAAPYYNALPRAFKDIKMVAIDAMVYHLFNIQQGIVGIPSLLLFHGPVSVAKYNGSQYNLDKFMWFIFNHTGIQADSLELVVHSKDFEGPVPYNITDDPDYFLMLSWAFIVVCSGYYFTKSRVWTWLVEAVKSNWRESEAHAQVGHEHVE